MELKKEAIIFFIIVFALVSYFYLTNHYNPNTAAFYFRGDISISDFKTANKYNDDTAVINLIMPYHGNQIIMTTGLDYLTENIALEKGSFLADINRKEAVIGDKVADKLFRSSIIGKQITFHGNSYEIKGIKANSHDIYISYDETLAGLDWQKKIIKHNFKNNKQFYLNIETYRNKLEALGLEVYDTVIYRENIRGYINLIILTAGFILLYYCGMLATKIKKSIICLSKDFTEKRRTIELHKYLLMRSWDVLKQLGMLFLASVMLIAIYKLLTWLYIPPAWVPDNLLSLSSYIKLIKLNYERYLLHLENGTSGILVDVKVINLVFMLLLSSIGIYMYKLKSVMTVFRRKG